MPSVQTGILNGNNGWKNTAVKNRLVVLVINPDMSY